MFDVVIRRCPYSKHIQVHAAEIYASLLLDFNRNAHIEDGEKNEFSIFVDGNYANIRSVNWLPTAEEVESAILKGTQMEYARTGVDETDEWLDRPTGEE